MSIGRREKVMNENQKDGIEQKIILNNIDGIKINDGNMNYKKI